MSVWVLCLKNILMENLYVRLVVQQMFQLNWLKKTSSVMPDITEAYNEEVCKNNDNKKTIMKRMIWRTITSILIKI